MRLGILSLAHVHAEDYIPNLKREPGVDFVGVSDLDPARGDDIASRHQVQRFTSHEALLAEGLDGVIICSENARHRQHVQMAAEAGVNILCEKPIDVTLADARAQRDACQANGVRYMTAFPMRFAPDALRAKASLDNDELGRVYAVNGINHSEIPREHRAWFAQKDLAGGGAVMDHTVHLADLYRWFFDCEIAEVYAEVDNLFYPGEVDVDTAGIVTLVMENGVFATIDCSWSRPMGYPRWGHLKMDIIGEEGFAVIDAFAEHVTLYSKGARRNPRWVDYGVDNNQRMIHEFVSAIREDREPAVSWRDGYEALRLALACYESAQTNQPVALLSD